MYHLLKSKGTPPLTAEFLIQCQVVKFLRECFAEFAVDFAGSRNAFGELGFFGGGEFDFNNFFDAVFAEADGHANAKIFFAVFAVEVDATGNEFLRVKCNRFDESRSRRAGRVPSGGSQKFRAGRAADFGRFDGFLNSGTIVLSAWPPTTMPSISVGVAG